MTDTTDDERRRVLERLEECGVEPAETRQKMATTILRRVRRARAKGNRVYIETEAAYVPEDLRRTVQMLNELAERHTKAVG